jgi:hypothetical protein
MARYFAGNTLAAFFRSNTTIVEVTTVGTFDPALVPNGISIPGAGGGATFIRTAPWVDGSTPTTISLHWEEILTGAGTTSSTWVQAVNSAGTVVFRLSGTAGVQQAAFFNGATFTNSGATFARPAVTTRQRFDLIIVCGASGIWELFSSGASIASGSITDADCDNITEFELFSIGNSTSVAAVVSQVLVADFDTRDSRYFCQRPLALGTLTDGSGAASDINEVPLDESTSVALTTAGDERSFTHSPFTLPSGFMIGAVCAAGRGRINGSGPTDGKFGIYDITATTSHLSPGLSLNAGFEPRGAIFETNPNTAADWTQADYNDAEIILAAA